MRGRFRIRIAAAACLAFLLMGTTLRGAGQDDRARLDFWKSNYTELRPEDDARAARAHEVFERVLLAAGTRAGVMPSLFIIKEAGATVPLAIALPDGGIVISRQVLDVCYGEPEKGDDRLAFVLAHEIAHQLKDDFWHLRFFAAVELAQKGQAGDAAAIEEVRRIASQSRDPLLKEMQADEYGIVYASMAGFDTRAIVTQDDRANFFRYFAAALDPGNIKGLVRDPEHPTPEARAAAVRARLTQVLEDVDLFDLGLLFYQSGDFETAGRLFADFLRSYPSREVHHDLATCHHQVSLGLYRDWKGENSGVPFKLSLTAVSETRARDRGGHFRFGPMTEEEARFKAEIGKAVEHYKVALSLDPSFWPAANNLGCALLLLDDPYEAVGALQKALQEVPGSPLVLGNLGAAFFMAENPSKAKEKLQEALKASPLHDAALYNLGMIAFLENDRTAAKKYWESFLRNNLEEEWTARLWAKMTFDPAPAPKIPAAGVDNGPEKLGGLAIGADTDQVPSGWGPPSRSRSFPSGADPLVLRAYANGITVVTQSDKIVLMTISPAYKESASRGVSPGAAAKEVLAKYGRPSAVGLTSEGEAWIYRERGIAFVVRGEKVVSWILFRPG
jgi:tetratricopeptide (TPR) repeat protein